MMTGSYSKRFSAGAQARRRFSAGSFHSPSVLGRRCAPSVAPRRVKMMTIRFDARPRLRHAGLSQAGSVASRESLDGAGLPPHRFISAERTLRAHAQLRRCAISIGSDIAEGCGRSTAPDILRFHQAAFASSLEMLHQLITATDLGYLDESDLASIEPSLETFRRKLSRLMLAIRRGPDRNAKRSGPRTDGSRSEPAEN
jgi:four helix bundle protein